MSLTRTDALLARRQSDIRAADDGNSRHSHVPIDKGKKDVTAKSNESEFAAPRCL